MSAPILHVSTPSQDTGWRAVGENDAKVWIRRVGFVVWCRVTSIPKEGTIATLPVGFQPSGFGMWEDAHDSTGPLFRAGRVEFTATIIAPGPWPRTLASRGSGQYIYGSGFWFTDQPFPT